MGQRLKFHTLRIRIAVCAAADWLWRAPQSLVCWRTVASFEHWYMGALVSAAMHRGHSARIVMRPWEKSLDCVGRCWCIALTKVSCMWWLNLHSAYFIEQHWMVSKMVASMPCHEKKYSFAICSCHLASTMKYIADRLLMLYVYRAHPSEGRTGMDADMRHSAGNLYTSFVFASICIFRATSCGRAALKLHISWWPCTQEVLEVNWLQNLRSSSHKSTFSGRTQKLSNVSRTHVKLSRRYMPTSNDNFCPPTPHNGIFKNYQIFSNISWRHEHLIVFDNTSLPSKSYKICSAGIFMQKLSNSHFPVHSTHRYEKPLLVNFINLLSLSPFATIK